MTVQELIDHLEQLDDKSLTVRLRVVDTASQPIDAVNIEVFRTMYSVSPSLIAGYIVITDVPF